MVESHSLSDKQRGLLSILGHFDSLCAKYGLRYFLGYGTALGSIRHSGFIPWDDDADIYMPREDFVIFCGIANSELCSRPLLVEGTEVPAYYTLESPIDDSHHGTCVANLEANTPKRERCTLDLFAIEGVPASRVARLAHGLACLYRGFLLACARDNRARESFLAQPALLTPQRRVRLELGKRLTKSVDYYRIKAWRTYGRYPFDAAELCTVPSGRLHYFGEMMPRSQLFPSRRVGFEGASFCVMNNVETYLAKQYGDYMTIPPESERPHHIMVGNVEVSTTVKSG